MLQWIILEVVVGVVKRGEDILNVLGDLVYEMVHIFSIWDGVFGIWDSVFGFCMV